MRIKRKHLNKLVENLLFEFGDYDPYGDDSPTPEEYGETSSPVEIAKFFVDAIILDPLNSYVDVRVAALKHGLAKTEQEKSDAIDELQEALKQYGYTIATEALAIFAGVISKALISKLGLKQAKKLVKPIKKRNINTENITKLGFNIVEPEPRQLKVIHASHKDQTQIKDMIIKKTTGGGTITRQSRKGRKMSGFYTFPKSQPTMNDKQTIKRAHKYVSDLAAKKPNIGIQNSYVHSFDIDPSANFAKYEGSFGMTRISPQKFEEYYDAGIDVIISKADAEELVIINPEVLINHKIIDSLRL